MLAAAAAVGDVALVQHYPQQRFRVMRKQSDNGFGCSLQTAATNGKTEVLDLLLPIASGELRSIKQRPEISSAHDCIDAAIWNALPEHSAVATKLVDFALQEYRIQASKKRRGWLIQAAKTGCFELLRHLIEDMDHGGHHNHIGDLVYEACKHGRVEVMRYLLAAGIIPHTYTLPRSTVRKDQVTMQLAVIHGHRTLVDLFHSYGAALSSSLLTDTLESNNAPRFPMVTHLINARCVVNQQDADALEAHAAYLLALMANFGPSGYIRTMDRAMTIVLIARELQLQILPHFMAPRGDNVNKIVQEVVTGRRLRLSKSPLESRKIASGYWRWSTAKKIT